MSNLTDFFPSGGGGGLTPKFEEFNASGTFTPTQALIDAGGYIEVFLVAGGGGGRTVSNIGAFGGEVLTKRMYLTSTTSCSVTIGAGGSTSSGSYGGDGANSVFLGSAAGGSDVTSNGGAGSNKDINSFSGSFGISPAAPGWGSNEYNPIGGVNGYGMGGPNSTKYTTGSNNPNSGQGGISSAFGSATAGASGYCLIKWYE